jgi:N-acetyltransferase
MQFEHLIPGRFIDLGSIAMDEKIWQNLPYNIKGKACFDVFVKVLQTTNLNNQQVTYVIRNKTTRQVCGSTGCCLKH